MPRNGERPRAEEFFAKDPAKADKAFFGRESCADRHLSGDPEKLPISRGLAIPLFGDENFKCLAFVVDGTSEPIAPPADNMGHYHQNFVRDQSQGELFALRRHDDPRVLQEPREGMHRLRLAVDQHCGFWPTGTAMPIQQFGLVSVRRETVDGENPGSDRHLLAKESDRFCAIDNTASQGSRSRKAHEDDAAVRA